LSTTGTTTPLVVVDGIQGYSGWERINPNDIESISVLKMLLPPFMVQGPLMELF